MQKEVLNYLAPALDGEDAVFCDLTLGLGGHTEYFLHNLANIRAVGVDRDASALNFATERLQPFADRFTAIQARFDDCRLANQKMNAVLMDLGVSSMQLDDDRRGFSYAKDTDLDMRMNQEQGKSAAEVVDDWGISDLAQIIRDYGEEKHAQNIAQSIKHAKPQRTHELADAIRAGLPPKLRRSPYAMQAIKRVFQAIRIAVNDELNSLTNALDQVIEQLELGGRIAVLSYHSLEDRIVKNKFRQGTQNYIDSLDQLKLPTLPSSNEVHAYLKLVTKGAQVPTQSEIESNSRALSAKLRVAEKIGHFQRGENNGDADVR
jgi:16S rRNA (cytosine1402-N4)-methyltransferase